MRFSMPISSRFVGRTVELDALDAALKALEGGTPRAIEVVGPAGIGKSRLLSELRARARARGHVVLTGSGAELEQDLPYWVFVGAMPARRDERGIPRSVLTSSPS
jgi:predicted ATPase